MRAIDWILYSDDEGQLYQMDWQDRQMLTVITNDGNRQVPTRAMDGRLVVAYVSYA